MKDMTIGKAFWIIVAGIIATIVLVKLYDFLVDAQAVIQFLKRSESY